jgi:DNA polymerase III alpha subunit
MTKDEALKLALEALEEITRRNQSDHQAEIAEEAIIAIKEALAQREQLMSDQINYGMSVTQGGNRIDPMSIYKEREQDGECKHCTDGCPACDARKLQKEAHDLL